MADLTNIFDLTTERLMREPLMYTVEFVHTHNEFRFVVHDVSGSSPSRLAVARDFEAAAESLRNQEND